MKKFNLLLIFLTLTTLTTLNAQEQYLDEQYDVSVQTDVVYGINATILPSLFQLTEAVPQPLIMDIYTPDDGGNDDRPVMLVFHSGYFLPHPQNNNTDGTLRDSTVVEVCTRLARRGYLACSVDYRLGWNPLDPTQEIRTFFFINAVYRGIQDARTAVRFMRLTAVDGGNPYGINPDNIGVWGLGAGGYIAAAVATLDRYEEISVLDKFLFDFTTAQPMVVESWNGNIYGTSYGILPVALPPLPAGDTLCYPNHVTYANGDTISSDISFVVNNGGALADISWLDENVPPWVSFHVPNDPLDPYKNAVINVAHWFGLPDPDPDPYYPYAIMDVDGSYNIQQKMNELGFNDIFETADPSLIDYEEVADARNDNYEGLFPLPINGVDDSAPWNFYSLSNPNAPAEPNDPVIARTYWDTIFAYVTPRACIAMNLGCAITNVNEINAAAFGFEMAPNPAEEFVTISSAADKPMTAYAIYDATGRIIQNTTKLNNSNHVIQRNGLANGLYYVKVFFEDGNVVQKLMLH